MNLPISPFALAVVLIGSPVFAQQAAPAATSAKTAPAKAAPKTAAPKKANAPNTVVEPDAVAALRRMGTHLRGLAKYEVTMATQRDEVDDHGQLVTFEGHTDYKVSAPDKFNIQASRKGKTRDYVYDGKSVTVYDPETHYYGRFDAPSTIRQTLDLAAKKYDITVPLDELVHWDQDSSNIKKLTSAHYVGITTVGGQEAAQYAFRTSRVDWQIWIAEGDKPLPLRVVIVARNDPARPRFEANLTWNTAPKFTADTFEFKPSPEAKPIPIDPTGS